MFIAVDRLKKWLSSVANPLFRRRYLETPCLHQRIHLVLARLSVKEATREIPLWHRNRCMSADCHEGHQWASRRCKSRQTRETAVVTSIRFLCNNVAISMSMSATGGVGSGFWHLRHFTLLERRGKKEKHPPPDWRRVSAFPEFHKLLEISWIVILVVYSFFFPLYTEMKQVLFGHIQLFIHAPPIVSTDFHHNHIHTHIKTINYKIENLRKGGSLWGSGGSGFKIFNFQHERITERNVNINT
jgi:hypothetical protein